MNKTQNVTALPKPKLRVRVKAAANRIQHNPVILVTATAVAGVGSAYFGTHKAVTHHTKQTLNAIADEFDKFSSEVARKSED